MTIEAVSSPNRQFHLILDTVSAAHDMNAYLNLLGRDGNLTLVGMTERPFLMPTLHEVQEIYNISARGIISVMPVACYTDRKPISRVLGGSA
jgi:D-arabinose 1-dehydrogenase-like Zn-dependent alcohol dehydrogenase